MSRKVIDRVGQVFGLVTVESYAGLADGKSTWNVVCKCGVRRVAQTQVLLNKPPRTHIACKRAKWAEREKSRRGEQGG